MLSTMRRASICLGWVLVSTVNVCAEQPSNASAQRDCFTVIMANPGGGGLGSILLDKCTGNSWVLARAALGNGMTANRWYPISVEKGEAISRTQAP